LSLNSISRPIPPLIASSFYTFFLTRSEIAVNANFAKNSRQGLVFCIRIFWFQVLG